MIFVPTALPGPGISVLAARPVGAFRGRELDGRFEKAEVKVNGLHWTAQILLAAVFLFAGFSEILSYRSRTKVPPGRPTLGFPGLPYELAVAIGVVEIAGALALMVPIDLWPPDILPRLAAAGLALLTIAGGVYHQRRRESAAPNVALFLLALFVIVGRWPR